MCVCVCVTGYQQCASTPLRLRVCYNVCVHAPLLTFSLYVVIDSDTDGGVGGEVELVKLSL